MTQVLPPTRTSAPERFRWALVVLVVAAVLVDLAGLITLVAQTGQLIEWLQPHARVPVTMDVSYPLPTNGMRNEYGGSPFVADGTQVVATRVTTVLDAVPFGNRLLLGLAPVLWTLTAMAVATVLDLVLLRLLEPARTRREPVRLVVLAAAVLAAGSTAAQLVQGSAQLGLGAFAWAAPRQSEVMMQRTGGATFEFTPLLVACGLLAFALVLRRASGSSGADPVD